MKADPVITKIEVHEYVYETKDIGLDRTGAIPTYRPGDTFVRREGVLQIHTDCGIVGEIAAWPFAEGMLIPIFTHALIGRNALDREGIYRDLKLLARAYGRVSMGIVDIALWDIAGKFFDAPIYKLLGGNRTKLPCYASTMNGGDSGGLSTPESFADFAEQCLEMGFPGFKIHPWPGGPIERHVDAVLALGKRVGGKMDLMLDPFCYYQTFGQALKVGRACDEAGFLWWEDPYADGGVSEFSHRKLRELVKTPLLQGEHIRGVEPHANLILSKATDFVRGDPIYDGITATMKTAHAVEALGLDIELHSCGPAQRHVIAAVPNSNYYEVVWTHPDIDVPFTNPNVHTNYVDGIDTIDADGCVPVPEGPGLGVDINWDWINKHRVGGAEYGG